MPWWNLSSDGAKVSPAVEVIIWHKRSFFYTSREPQVCTCVPPSDCIVVRVGSRSGYRNA